MNKKQKKFNPGRGVLKCQLIRLATHRDRFTHAKGPHNFNSWGSYFNIVESYQAAKREFPDMNMEYPRFTNRYYS